MCSFVFAVAGDSVLVTAFDENPIAPLVLGNGRTLCALVADMSKKDDVDKAVDAACTDAMRHGWFAELCKANVIISGSTLPSIVPENNLSNEAVPRHLEGQELAGPDVETEETSCLYSARVFADEFHVEIEPSSIHGLGLFAVHDLPKDEAMPIPLMGDFEFHTPEGAFGMMLDDKVPRHPLLDASDFSVVIWTQRKSRPMTPPCG
ncbi:unnamed protein product [Ectocarpus sp. CCAP 1310/34]|nr:unnamed protein product [Ectocarpus sp. CCAP 1310/34]